VLAIPHQDSSRLYYIPLCREKNNKKLEDIDVQKRCRPESPKKEIAKKNDGQGRCNPSS